MDMPNSKMEESIAGTESERVKTSFAGMVFQQECKMAQTAETCFIQSSQSVILRYPVLPIPETSTDARIESAGNNLSPSCSTVTSSVLFGSDESAFEKPTI